VEIYDLLQIIIHTSWEKRSLNVKIIIRMVWIKKLSPMFHWVSLNLKNKIIFFNISGSLYEYKNLNFAIICIKLSVLTKNEPSICTDSAW